jgi:hypothetical protein
LRRDPRSTAREPCVARDPNLIRVGGRSPRASIPNRTAGTERCWSATYAASGIIRRSGIDEHPRGSSSASPLSGFFGKMADALAAFI